MGRLARYNAQGLAELLGRQHGVIGRAQALQLAMTEAALRYRIRPDGPWQVLLPGVYLSTRGVPTTRQRIVAAFCYPGDGAIAVTGQAAVAWHGVRGRWGDEVDVLVAPGCRRRDAGFARLHVTKVPPAAALRDGTVAYAPLARAIADGARQLSDLGDVRAIVAAGVQQGRVTVRQLVEELAGSGKRGSAMLRRALAEVADGARSTSEADLLGLIRWARLPAPLLNPRLVVAGEFLAMPDAYWPDAGVAAEADSREWHLSPADWELTMARHARMSACGLIVLHYPPSRIKGDRRAVAAELRAAIAAGRDRPRLPIRVVPS